MSCIQGGKKKKAMKNFPNFVRFLDANIASFGVWNSDFGSRFPLAGSSSAWDGLTQVVNEGSC